MLPVALDPRMSRFARIAMQPDSRTQKTGGLKPVCSKFRAAGLSAAPAQTDQAAYAGFPSQNFQFPPFLAEDDGRGGHIGRRAVRGGLVAISSRTTCSSGCVSQVSMGNVCVFVLISFHNAGALLG